MNFNDSIFWDVNPKEINKDEHAHFIISRVVQRGLNEDWEELRRVYSEDEIKCEIIKIKSLDAKTLNFLSLFYKIPIANFECYTQAQLRDQHWNS